MVYGNSKVRSTAYETDKSVYVDGNGSCSSDRLSVHNAMAERLVRATNSACENAYRALKNRNKEDD